MSRLRPVLSGLGFAEAPRWHRDQLWFVDYFAGTVNRTDLTGSMAFYEALGFTNQPRFTDDTAGAMQWSDTIVVMLEQEGFRALFRDS